MYDHDPDPMIAAVSPICAERSAISMDLRVISCKRVPCAKLLMEITALMHSFERMGVVSPQIGCSRHFRKLR